MKPPDRGGRRREKKSAGIKEKLASLEKYMPGQSEATYEFARFLSTRADDTLVPLGFDVMAALVLYDLRHGKDGLTGDAIQDRLTEYPPEIYDLLQLQVPQIKEIIFGEQK